MRDYYRPFTFIFLCCYLISLPSLGLNSGIYLDRIVGSSKSITQSDTGFVIIGPKGVSARMESDEVGLGKTLFVKAIPGDTLFLPNVIPVKNPSFVLACCGEAGYLLDSIYGLYIIIPSFVEPNEVYTISFEGSLKPNLPVVDFLAFNRVVENRLVFSRSMELRLTNRLSNGVVEYALAEDRMPVFHRYNKPLLISKSTTVYARVRINESTCQGYSRIRLERSNDVMAVDCERNLILVEPNEGRRSCHLRKEELLNLVLSDSLFPSENSESACWFEKEITLMLDRATLKPFGGLDLFFLMGKDDDVIKKVSCYSEGIQIKGRSSFNRVGDVLKVCFIPEHDLDVRTLKVKASQSFWHRLIGTKRYFRLIGLHVKPSKDEKN